jgi:hypothetical protein
MWEVGLRLGLAALRGTRAGQPRVGVAAETCLRAGGVPLHRCTFAVTALLLWPAGHPDGVVYILNACRDRDCLSRTEADDVL